MPDRAGTQSLRDSGVVVTGAGGGIGAALARRFAAAGARVVVNDLDVAKAEAVATEIGGVAVPGDASTVVPAAREALNGTPIGTFCANAGTGVGGGPEAPDELWEAAWDVNLMAHVRAARELVPEWLERGAGRFVATASAAGLLTMVGAAPYSVTKHAALSFAEWLSVTYRHRGIDVHAICPQGVRTDMLDGSGAAGGLVLVPGAIEPEEVAVSLFDAIEQGRFLVLPHEGTDELYAARAADPDTWLTGMNRLQQKLDGAAAGSGQHGAEQKETR